MSQGRPRGTLGERLTARRRQAFVGRADELTAFAGCVHAAEPSAAAVYVHGPGGIGKTSLLEAFADMAAATGATVVRVDGRELPPSPPHLLDALGATRLDDDTVSLTADRVVLLVDTYERLTALDDWVRTWLIPRLPHDVVVVLSGRNPPGAGWLADPAWRDLLRVLPLRNLTPAESQSFLEGAAVDPALHERIVETARGHPLALSLLADIVARGGDLVHAEPGPEFFQTLVHRLVDVVPTEQHRRALEVCALARTTTEGLLREAVPDGSARELFDWLCQLSFVEHGASGLVPHELAREALEADLHWRDPETYRRVFESIRSHTIHRLKQTSGRQQQQVLFDAKFMHRYQPVSRMWADWETFGQHFAEPALGGDRADVLALAEKWEGSEAAEIVARWWARQPEAFHVVRAADQSLHGFIAMIDLTRAAPDDLAADPGARAAWEHARRRLGVRPGETAGQMRFVMDATAYQDPSPTINLGPVLSIQRWLSTPGLAVDFLTFADPDKWNEYFGFFEIPRVTGADFEVGGRSYGLFVRDFRRIGLDDWLQLMFERDLTGDHAPPSTPADEVVVLSQPDFDAAVRQALRHLTRPAALAGNPLLRSPLVLSRVGEQAPVAVLVDLVREAAAELRNHPRDEKFFRVLDRTYLRPAPTQEAAAEVLDLPLSTYKRHLRAGVERVVAHLWDRELNQN